MMYISEDGTYGFEITGSFCAHQSVLNEPCRSSPVLKGLSPFFPIKQAVLYPHISSSKAAQDYSAGIWNGGFINLLQVTHRLNQLAKTGRTSSLSFKYRYSYSVA